MHQIPVEDKTENPSHKPQFGNPWSLSTILAFLLGLGGGYLPWSGSPTSDIITSRIEPQTAVTTPQVNLSEEPEEENTLVDLIQQVNEPDGYILPVSHGELGPQLLASRAIDENKFITVYQRAGQPLTDSQISILRNGSNSPITFNHQNACFLLNFFWALGLANQNPILNEGPVMINGPDQIGRFASTGGRIIGAKSPDELYASTPLTPLTSEQQARLEKVAQNVYRPCCNNPTHFPDCNHGMAMLGLLTLLASRNATEGELFEAAKYANAFWYPQQTTELAVFFRVVEGVDFADVDDQEIVSAKFSTGAGIQNVHQLLVANGMHEQAPNNGSGCGV